jgi:hypothetical protein
MNKKTVIEGSNKGYGEASLKGSPPKVKWLVHYILDKI